MLATSLAIVTTAGDARAQSASANDTARLLAGIRPSPDSPLASITKDRAWQQHASRLNAIFGKVESEQLAHIRTWSRAKLTSPSPVLFYMFSGPDFLYANAFFPNASTYVMSGLEPTGPIPDLTKLARGSLGPSLRNIEESLSSILAYSFFQTIDMRRTLVASRVTGTLPILYVFLARSGKTIRDVSLVKIDKDGNPQIDYGTGPSPTSANSARGVKIEFAGEDGGPQTLYYFNVNVANDGFKTSGFARFCERLGTGDAFIKSASYLMHRDRFSDLRDFLLEHSRLLLQDDSGIPVTHFDQTSWRLRPFGHYSSPIELFANRYQPKLAELFDRDAEAIDFGIGYRWRAQSSNLMLAVKTDMVRPDAVASVKPGSVSGGESIINRTPSDRSAGFGKQKTTDRNKVPASGQSGSISGGASIVDVTSSDTDRAGRGTDFGKHKTMDSGKVHRISKHATRDRLVTKTAARPRSSRARAAYAFSQPHAAYTFFWPYWFGAPR
jgi:hypothetical protein